MIASDKERFRVYGGPGTGKTELAIHKAASIYKNSRGKAKILLLARTKGEVRTLEIKSFQLLGNNPLEVTTFHSLALKSLTPKS
ncbi:MAG: AAA family ATPase [candidate division Zixibacteria bacterium]|nr:AAA family ATPase [Candidatus Tariuqbacter arcticus]